jgi:hypothetical protein
VEGVLSAASVGDRVGQWADHVEELRERPRIGVGQQQWSRVGLFGSNVYKVHGLPLDFGYEVRDRVHPGLLRAPVELLPRGDHLLQVGNWGPVVPAVTGRRDGVTSVGEAALQILERLFGDRDGKGTDGAGLAGDCG